MDLIITILPVVTKDLPISPRFTPYVFLSRCKFSTLTTRQPMVEFYLLTFPCFPLRKKEHKSYFGKNRTHDFRTNTEVIGGIGAACVHDPRSGQNDHIDAYGAIEGGSTWTVRVSVSGSGDDSRLADEQGSIVVSLEQVVVCCKVSYVCGFGPYARECDQKERGVGEWGS